MTESLSHAEAAASRSKLLRAAIWVVIGALIAGAFVCVFWVLFGTQGGLVGRAFLTILLLAAFAGAAILDVRLAANRPVWFALASMAVWIVTLLIGAFMIWMPGSEYDLPLRVIDFLVIILVLQLALLHARLFWKAHERHPMTFTLVVTYVTIALVVILALLLVFPLMLHEWVTFSDLYWRFVVAVTILAALGTALVPLINALFAPRKPRAAKPLPWPTYADGRTPLPAMPDGQPDWEAYRTGRPTYAQAVPAAGPAWTGAAPALPAASYPAPGAYAPQAQQSATPAWPAGEAPAQPVPPAQPAPQPVPPVVPMPGQPLPPAQPVPPTAPPTEPPAPPATPTEPPAQPMPPMDGPGQPPVPPT